MKETRIIDITISELKGNPENPRIMPKAEMEKLKRSIKEFGYVEPVIIDENNLIIGGHQRVEAMRALNIQVPIKAVKLLGYTENEKKALNIALNKISGEWDFDKLQEWLADLQIEDSGINLDITGFDLEDIENIEIKQEKKANEKEKDNLKKVCPHCGMEI